MYLRDHMIYVDYEAGNFSTFFIQLHTSLTSESRSLISVNITNLKLTDIIYMSTFSTAEVRKMVDDLDDVIRSSVVKGDVETVFGRERANMVSYRFRRVTNESKTFLG
jgi:hypothetical protein